MRKVVSFIASHVLYWVGDFFSLIMNGFGFAKVYGWWPTYLLYRPYNWCMITSCEIEEWAGTDFVWKENKETQSEPAP